MTARRFVRERAMKYCEKCKKKFDTEKDECPVIIPRNSQ